MPNKKTKDELEELFKVSLEEAKKHSNKEKDEDDEEEEKDSKKKEVKESIASDTLKAGSRPDPNPDALSSSKVSVMQSIMKTMNGMSKEDLNHFAATMAQFGPNKDYGVGDNSAKNSASIDMKSGSGPKTKDPMPKLNVKEDLEEIFTGHELSEEFKENLETIFEAAVSARLVLETARLEEEFETKINEEIVAFQEEVTTKLDSYLDYVVENWMKENEVAIESALRNEIMEEFIEGLRNLFAENYINVPEEKVDVLEALAEKVEALEAKLDEAINENVELKDLIAEEKAKDIFEEVASDLVLSQKEKFAALAEGIEFDGNFETYTKKLKIVKENYFKTSNNSYSTNFEEEDFEGETTSNKVSANDPQVNRYLAAIARTVKK